MVASPSFHWQHGRLSGVYGIKKSPGAWAKKVVILDFFAIVIKLSH